MTRHVLLTLAAVAALALVAGAAVVFGGLFNVSARNGHLPGVPWVLHTTYQNAVERLAPPASAVPDLTEDLAELGARHFDAACRGCHAAPGQAQTATIESMLPEPPHVTAAIEGWGPEHLAWIVREGVKMSGMPGWPSVRDDEEWAVVAFLVRVPDLDASAYADLVARPDAPAGAPLGLAYCAGCHGLDGRSGNPHIPRLDIQGEAYLAESLAAFRSGRRESGIMAQAASEVPPEALAELAAYFAAQTPDSPDAAAAAPAPGDPALVARGEALARRGDGPREVPACLACHGGLAGAAPDHVGPSIAGQHEAYIDAQLRLWRAGIRGGGPRANLMAEAAEELTDADIAALAAYFAGLPPAPPAPPARPSP